MQLTTRDLARAAVIKRPARTKKVNDPNLARVFIARGGLTRKNDIRVTRALDAITSSIPYTLYTGDDVAIHAQIARYNQTISDIRNLLEKLAGTADVITGLVKARK